MWLAEPQEGGAKGGEWSEVSSRQIYQGRGIKVMVTWGLRSYKEPKIVPKSGHWDPI